MVVFFYLLKENEKYLKITYNKCQKGRYLFENFRLVNGVRLTVAAATDAICIRWLSQEAVSYALFKYPRKLDQMKKFHN